MDFLGENWCLFRKFCREEKGGMGLDSGERIELAWRRTRAVFVDNTREENGAGRLGGLT